jgi:hypothetical protein
MTHTTLYVFLGMMVVARRLAAQMDCSTPSLAMIFHVHPIRPGLLWLLAAYATKIILAKFMPSIMILFTRLRVL